jgi:ketosteroid isomerase-like protein
VCLGVSEDKVELVQRVLEAVGRGDVAAIQADVDTGFELHPLVSVWQRTYVGHAGIESWKQDLAQLWEEFHLELVEAHEHDDETLVTLTKWRGRPIAGSAELEGPVAAVVRFRAGKAIRADFYVDLATAYEAAESS